MKITTLINSGLDNEEELIEQARTKPECFKPLYEKYYRPIFRFIYNKLLDKEITADITSNVFIKAMTSLDKYGNRNLPFSAWLYKIAYNELMQYFRKERKERKVVINEEVLWVLSEETQENDVEIIKKRFESIFDLLSLDDLEFIELRFYEGLTFYQIGMILGITENYAKVKTHRILEKIRHKYRSIRH